MKIIIKNKEQIDGIKKACKKSAKILKELGKSVKPGITTQQIDDLCIFLMEKENVISASLGYHGFPKNLCVSLNNVICHGIPSDSDVLKEGDIVKLDFAGVYEGYYGDNCKTFAVGNISKKSQKLIDVTKRCLERGINQVYPGNHLSNIGYSIQKYAEKHGFSVVQDFCGHGVGLKFHEEPQVLHYGRKNRGPILKPGMIFTIEPMINEGKYECTVDDEDGWTVRTIDESFSAQFEHTLLVTEDGVEVLTK